MIADKTVPWSPVTTAVRAYVESHGQVLRRDSARPSRYEEPASQGQGAHRDQPEHPHPEPSGQPGEPGKLVGVVRDLQPPPPAPPQFEHRPQPAEEQEPRHHIPERRL